jgi:hypothetical protein
MEVQHEVRSAGVTTLTQCRFERPDGTGVRTECGWIETRAAQVGHRVRFLATNTVWRVVEVGATWPESRVKAYERDWVTMPTVTDAFSDGHGHRRLPVKPR